MSENQQKSSKNERSKNAMAYIPVVAIVLFFAEDNKPKELMKHIKYGFFLLIVYVVIVFILDTILWLGIWAFLATVYLLLSWYLWYKAYNWEDVNLEYFDKMEEKVKSNFEENFPSDIWEKVKKKITKKEEK